MGPYTATADGIRVIAVLLYSDDDTSGTGYSLEVVVVPAS